MYKMRAAVAYLLIYHFQLLCVFFSLVEGCFDITHDMTGILGLKIILHPSITETVLFEAQ